MATDSRQGAGGGLCEGVSVRFLINTFQMASVAQVCLPHDFGAISHNLHVHHAASGNISSQVQLRELCLEENAKQTNKNDASNTTRVGCLCLLYISIIMQCTFRLHLKLSNGIFYLSLKEEAERQVTCSGPHDEHIS